MKQYDVVIVGGATAGAYFAKKLAGKGHSVLILEKLSKEKLGTRMDIFHVSGTDLDTFDMPKVNKGDAAWGFAFSDNGFSSPSNRIKVYSQCDIVGLHMHEYVALMVRDAIAAGAQIEYEAAFTDFLFENGKISGVTYSQNGEEKSVSAKTVIDASGMNAVCRRKLPLWYGMETFSLAPDELFYVILRYVRFNTPQENTFWLNTKSWFAPFSMDETEKIIGTGAVCSFENAEKTYHKLDKATQSEFEVLRTEQGATPYRRPPYTLVADNFIVTGDAACLTKPENGEGVTSAMVFMDIAAEVLDKALANNDTSREALWRINNEYNKKQGAGFHVVRAFLTKVIKATDEELEYCFENQIIFNETFLNNGKVELGDILEVLKGIGKGLIGKHISAKTLTGVIQGAKNGILLQRHYLNFPDTPAGFYEWCQKADKLWQKVGKVS